MQIRQMIIRFWDLSSKGAKLRFFLTRWLSKYYVYRDARYWKIRMALLCQKSISLPMDKIEIEKLSQQYQKNGLFEKDLKLMRHTLNLFPGWKYALKRLKWHSRPIFHKNPEKSKTQPRKSLDVPRESQYIPKKETLDQLCFVTGSSSNAPYFELAVQLIESLKATKHYSQIPIKILDCGLNNEDREYFIERFGAEVKDPGWDVDIRLLNDQSNPFDIPKNGYKGIVARTYLDKHFPGYEYYFWLDADTWVQLENGLDQFVWHAEKQGFGLFVENKTLGEHEFQIALHPDYLKKLQADQKIVFAGIFCMHKSVMKLYRKLHEENLKKLKKYMWGSDMICLHYVIYFYFKDAIFLSDTIANDQYKEFASIKNSLYYKNKPVPIIVLCWNRKFWPYDILFSNISGNVDGLYVSLMLSEKNREFGEEMTYQYCQKYGWQRGGYFYRTFEF